MLYIWREVFKIEKEVIIALLSFVGTVIGSLVGVFSSSRLSLYRIEQLEKKVDKHNNLIERVYKIEEHSAVVDEEIKVANHRIADLEDLHNNFHR